MFLVGLILFAAAVAAAVIGIVQNRHLVIDVHALGHTWTVHAYWVLVAGVIVAVVGLLGLAIINSGAERSRRLRRERRALARENKRLSKLPETKSPRPSGGLAHNYMQTPVTR
jgi:hypothetical protein